jgi:hypothetical protein
LGFSGAAWDGMTSRSSEVMAQRILRLEFGPD